MKIQNNSNITYTARSFHIKNAQWVCHTVNTVFPHTSSTRFFPQFKKFVMSQKEYVPTASEIDSMEKILDALYFVRDKIKLEKLKFNPSKANVKLYEKISSYIKNIASIGYSRMRYEYNEKHGASYILGMLSKAKMGNCYEDAKAAELVLLMNGIKNACTASLEARFAGKINHNLCVFNLDGSKFNGVINKNTIVIDPWVQKADYADVMLKYYRNMCQKFFKIPNDKKLDITPTSKLEITQEEIEKIKKDFPKLIYKKTL